MADRQKVRDFITYSSVHFRANDQLVSILDVGGGQQNLVVGDSPWINKLAHMHEILALRVNDSTALDSYLSLRDYVFIEESF